MKGSLAYAEPVCGKASQERKQRPADGYQSCTQTSD